LNDTQDTYGTQSFVFRPIDQARNIRNKRHVMDGMQALAEESLPRLPEIARTLYTEDCDYHISHPLNDLQGRDTALQQLWQALRHALPDMERREHFLAGGRYRDSDWVACMGHYLGSFMHDLLGIPATRGVVCLRYCEGHELREGRIQRSYIFLDFLDLMRQAGYFPLAPSLGREMRWPPPRTLDGTQLAPRDPARSQQTITAVLAMHRALGFYSGGAPVRAALDEMEQVRHWHPHFMWYGPAGIGSTRGLRGFEDYHQIPFLLAFPDRAGSEQGHFIRIGDGYFAVTGGWGYLRATHSGGELFGLAPTGRRIRMRVMDFYRCDDDSIAENWVPIDIPHILLQMGVDIFGRMRHQFRQQGALSASEWLVPQP